MKRHILILAALVGLLSIARANPVLLNETFSGSSLNTTNWTAFAPYSDSSTPVGGGTVKLNNGAGLLSNADYETPIEVIFSFAFTGNVHDSFRLYTRVDDFRDTGYHVEHGIGVSFRIKEDTGSLFGNIALEDSSGTLATGTFALSSNISYTGRLVDTGSAFGFYWGADLIPFLTATSNEDYGDKIAVWNRHGAGAGSYISAGSQMSIDSITVIDLGGNKVPDGGVMALLVGLPLIALMGVRRRLA